MLALVSVQELLENVVTFESFNQVVEGRSRRALQQLRGVVGDVFLDERSLLRGSVLELLACVRQLLRPSGRDGGIVRADGLGKPRTEQEPLVLCGKRRAERGRNHSGCH